MFQLSNTIKQEIQICFPSLDQKMDDLTVFTAAHTRKEALLYFNTGTIKWIEENLLQIHAALYETLCYYGLSDKSMMAQLIFEEYKHYLFTDTNCSR